jgi:adenylate cyclase
MKWTSLFAELRRRNVIRMAGLYLVGAWLLTQVSSTVLPMFDAPPWLPRSIVILLAIGFIPALIFAWVFELTPEGLKRDAEVKPEDSIAPQTARRMDRMIIVVLIGALVYFGFDKFVLAPQREAGRAAATMNSAPGNPVNKDSSAAPAIATDSSIAVLPFVNMSSDKEQEYFSDGLSEELLNQLAQIPQLRVIARTSSFSFKGKEVDVATIAKALNVANVLEGSVRKSGNTLRITAQLIRAADSSHLWSQTYDREMADIFKVQDEISHEVVSALKLQLLPGKLPDNTQHTRNPAAYEQYLIGKDVSRTGGWAAAEAAKAAFERAVALDPGYANAYALLAFTQGFMADFAENPAEREAVIDQALATADTAITLAPDLPDGYASRGNIRHRTRWDWQGAQSDFSRAIALDPNNARTLFNYAPVLFSLGRRDEGIVMLRKAVASDPLSDDAWNVFGRHLHATGALAEAQQAFERALELNPRQNWANFLLGNLLLAEGKTDLAIAHYQLAPEQFRTTGMAMAEFTRGNEAASQQMLAKMEKDYTIGFAFQIAQAYAWRGDKDQAFAWLDRAYAIHDSGLVRLPYDPAMDPLRDDPRFIALVRKMGFPK